jgi:hypothetical protein
MASTSLSRALGRRPFVRGPRVWLRQDLTEYRAVEEFSYFTLRKEASETRPATSLFGIACTRQLESSSLKNRPADVTRSTVQKALVVISDRPQQFGHLREKLSIVTKAWFAQRYISIQMS